MSNITIIISIIIQYFNGCPNTEQLIKNVDSAIVSLNLKDSIKYEKILIENLDLAKEHKFRGSPTLLINGKDIENMSEPKTPSLSCRYYPNGIPSPEKIKSKVLEIIKK